MYKPRGGVSAKTTILAEAYTREFTVIMKPLRCFLTVIENPDNRGICACKIALCEVIVVQEKETVPFVSLSTESLCVRMIRARGQNVVGLLYLSYNLGSHVH